MSDVTWISKEAVLEIHRLQLVEHGGLDGIRDEGMLDSALARPVNVAHYSDKPSVTQLAAAYTYGLARNHPFLDGNKRTAYVVCRTFLILNGRDLTADHDERYDTFIALADGSLSEEALANWIEANSAPTASQ